MSKLRSIIKEAVEEAVGLPPDLKVEQTESGLFVASVPSGFACTSDTEEGAKACFAAKWPLVSKYFPAKQEKKTVPPSTVKPEKIDPVTGRPVSAGTSDRLSHRSYVE